MAVLGGRSSVCCGVRLIGVRLDEGWVWGGVFKRNLNWGGLGTGGPLSRCEILRDSEGAGRNKEETP